MNEIKLRAWDYFNEVMVYSDEDDAIFILEKGKWKIKYVREKTLCNEGIEIDAPVWEESDEVEVMAFIGLQDKNGKQIYDGDIVTGWKKGSNSDRGYTGKIEWQFEQAGWVIKSHKFIIEILSLAQSGWANDPHNIYQLDSFEVIGNIHQHPNLLK